MCPPCETLESQHYLPPRPLSLSTASLTVAMLLLQLSLTSDGSKPKGKPHVPQRAEGLI